MKDNREIDPIDVWNEKKNDGLKDFILLNSKKQSDERKLQNELLSIQYQIEDYINNENAKDKQSVLDFVKKYLRALNTTPRKMATLFEMRDSNLHKYLVGERRLNQDIIFKLSCFSHTKPEYWLRIQVKNDLFEKKKNKENIEKYKKYDYKNLFETKM